MVLPAANAMRSLAEGFSRSGWKRATNGTLEMTWLKRTLRARIEGIEVKLTEFPGKSAWTTPDLQTLSIRTNMEAKKIRVLQSMRFRTSNLLSLKRMIGRAERTAI